MFDPIKLRRAGLAMAVGLAFAAVPAAAQAAPTVGLGTTNATSVLGGSTVTNTGSSVLSGDVDVSPGTAITGFPPGAVINGTIHANDGVAQQAQADTTTAYNDAAGRSATPLASSELGGTTLVGGTYSAGTLEVTGNLTLDGQNDPDSVFVFQSAATLIAASSSSISFINGAQPCNVFWQVTSSATIGSGSNFAGNILALQSITLVSGADLEGRALARNGAVTLDDNRVNRTTCAAGTVQNPTTPTPIQPTPTEPGPTATTPVATTPTPTTSGGAPTTGTTNQAPPASRSRVATRNGSATLKPTSPTSGSSSTSSKAPFRAVVRGRQIKRVVFSLDGKRIATRSGSTFTVSAPASAGSHKLTARVTFKDATSAKTLTLRYRGQTTQVLQPRHGPSQFTG